tara:strand:+ start:2333 stop:4174 length:1842 start_codon:yes stop_codon:yes gene_type:complete
MKWIFGNPTPPYQDPVDKEFFSLDQIQDDAMVREAGQNSRDALLESETLVRLRFTIIEESKNSMEQSKFFADLYEHINADESGITTPPPNDEKYRFLVIEDFFTHGLLGDINYVSTREPQKINHYYYLLRWLGRTGKSEGLGSWGVGKNMYARISEISTFFAYSIRDENPPNVLSGFSILKHHNVDEVDYAALANFGTECNGIVIPITDESVINEFKEEFKISRNNNDTGLSVVIPFLRPEITKNSIVLASIRQWCVAILEKDLEVEVIDENESIVLNSENINEILNSLDIDEEEKQKIGERVEFIKWILQFGYTTEKLVQLEKIRAGITPQWSGTLLTEAARDMAITRLREDGKVGFKSVIGINCTDGRTLQGNLFVFVQKQEGLSPEYYFYRSNLFIPGVRAQSRQGYRVVVAADGDLATILRDAEGPAHYDWTEATEDFNSKYVHGRELISFVKNSVSRLIHFIIQPIEEKDTSLLKKWFPRPENPEVDGGDPQDPELPENGIKRRPKLKVSPLSGENGGILIKDNVEIKVLEDCYKVEVVYDIITGNPLTGFSETDFNFLDGVEIIVSNVEITSIKSNSFKFTPTAREFSVEIRGIDVRYKDLICRILP